VHEQRGGDLLTSSVVQQPGAQRLDELLAGRVGEVVQRRQHAGAEVGERLAVRTEHEVGEPAVGVQRLRARGDEPQLERPHGPGVGGGRPGPGPGRPDDGVATVEGPQQGRPGPVLGVGHQQDDAVGGLLLAGHVLASAQRAPVERDQHPADRGLRQDHGGERPRGCPVGPFRGGRELRLRAAGEQEAGQSLEVPGAHPPGRLQLVAVPCGAGRRQLVDVGEHQLGESRQLRAGQPGGDGVRAQVPPGDPRAHPVGGEEGIHRAPAACLAPAQLVGPGERGLDGRAGVGSAAGRGQLEEPAERQLDRVPDGLAHVAGEGIGVTGDLDDDLGDGGLGDRGQLRPHRIRHGLRECGLFWRHPTLVVRGEQKLPADSRPGHR